MLYSVLAEMSARLFVWYGSDYRVLAFICLSYLSFTYLEIKEFSFVGTPYRVVETILLRHDPQSFISIVGIVVVPNTRLSAAIAPAPVEPFWNTLGKLACAWVESK